MSVLVIRHGLSEANNYENVGTLAFASMEAPLMEQGREHARRLEGRLLGTYGIITANTAVATSMLRRTQETAEQAGFLKITTYASLNEVVHGVDLRDLRRMLAQHQLPRTALEAARAIVENPPAENIWVTHGLVIAGLCRILDTAQNDRFIPRFCEVREHPIVRPVVI